MVLIIEYYRASIIMYEVYMDKFVNRTQDTKKMKKILKTKNRVHIISSTAGTGKSSLILHVLGTYMTNRFITVESDELFFCDKAEKWYFAEKICDGLIDILDINKVKAHLYKFIDRDVKFGASITAGFASLDLEFNRKFTIMQECIIDCLKNCDIPIMIHIENAHKIDYNSLQFIIRIIKETTCANFIFECQINAIGCMPTNIISVLQQFKIGIDYWEIEMLDWNHVCEILENKQLPLLEESKTRYLTSNGNLKDLLSYNSFKYNVDIELEDEHLFLLDFIALTQGELSQCEISEIIINYPATSDYFLPLVRILEYINDLLQYQLVGKNKEKIFITHLGIQYRKRSKDNLIIEMLANFYIPIINQGKSNEKTLCLQGLKILLPIFSQNADSRIAQLLPALSCNITPLRCEKSTLDDLYLHIDFNADNDDIRIILIRIYIQLGEYKEAYEKINEILYRGNDLVKVLYATLLSHLYPNVKTEGIINNLLTTVGPEAKSALYTCLVALYMKTKETKSVLDYVAKIKSKKELTTLDSCIIDKNISIYFDFKTAKRMLSHASVYFANNNMNRLTIASCITMATRLTQEGNLDKAKTLLSIVQNRRDLSEVDYMYICNNNAVIDLLSAKENKSTIRNIKNAYFYIQDEYTKLLATNNLLIYYTDQQKFDDAKKFAEELETVGFNKYKFEDYLHLTYLNLRYYYKNIDSDKFELYSDKLFELQKTCEGTELSLYIKSHFETVEFKENHRWKFMSSFEFRPAFMGHWIINNFDY